MDKRLETTLSEMQGQLFEASGELGVDSATFIKAFMNSDIAKGLDSEFDFMQWAGKEYILEKMQDEMPEAFVKQGKVFDKESLYWTGYVYRRWHYLTGESSKAIYKQANADVMNTNYLGYHTVDVELAIEWLKEAKQHTCNKVDYELVDYELVTYDYIKHLLGKTSRCFFRTKNYDSVSICPKFFLDD